ncbi:cupin domain-containing protein [Jiella marina]|uniref:hypothetical protein n=1 Tax=Jiella sp. LLJ827 TaxID=2917712 RepID=UPI002100941B|nr:hypothetical protein [Jiella sp. LLJ827]MCQ0986810.1 hypothetical protein [Jiella sp. LLJ827]
MKAALADFLTKLPLPATAKHPCGRFDVEALAHGTMSLKAYAPRGEDRQGESRQDMLIVVMAGDATLDVDSETNAITAGDAAFVAAGSAYRLTAISDDFAAWTVEWGSAGGEAEAPNPSVFAAIDA